jgi:ATP-dependent helicase HrpB
MPSGSRSVPPRPLAPLPLDDHIPAIAEQLRRHRAVVVTAAPGSGKTTRLPPALTAEGPVVLLQPRRVAARAVAARIADERGWTLGRDVGWHIRFERRFTADTRLLVVTEGILTARAQHDPLLSDFVTIVIDEFHERSVHADLGLALARQAWLARDDLRLVVMSATLECSRVAAFLGNCPIVAVPGTLHPTTIDYAPGQSVAEAAAGLLPDTGGTILCFLPGAREIARAHGDLAGLGVASSVPVIDLHGSLDGAVQDDALRPAAGRRVILATNIAETSLTVPGVATVVDSGLVKVARYDARRGIDSLSLERVTADSAAQRAGRSSRHGPGRVRRLWDARDTLRPHVEPEIVRVDLAGVLLAVLVWGTTLAAFEWFEMPPADRVEAALDLLRRLGALDGPTQAPAVTAMGRLLQRMPLHPRLGRILIEGQGARNVAAACALLSGPLTLSPGVATSCDLLPAIDRFEQQPAHVRRLAHELSRMASHALGSAARGSAQHGDPSLERTLLAGYPDRVARRRPGSGDRFVLATGHGAVLARESGVRDAEFVVALDVIAAERDGAAESRITAASRVEREWLVATAHEDEHRFDAASNRVRASRVARYDALVLSDTPLTPQPGEVSRLLAEAWLEREPDAPTQQLLRRARFAGIDLDLPALARRAAEAASTLDAVDVEAHLDVRTRQILSRDAPASLIVPSGRPMKLDYADDGAVSVAVKLQELFGLADSPMLGQRRVPVTFHLLAPNGRPVQTTRDLRSFWERTYPEVRKELRARYPKHPWPDDPWTARPTHRTTRRSP